MENIVRYTRALHGIQFTNHNGQSDYPYHGQGWTEVALGRLPMERTLSTPSLQLQTFYVWIFGRGGAWSTASGKRITGVNPSSD